MAGFVNESGVFATQDSLDKVYEWVHINNMRWNNNKFQMLRLGKRDDLKQDTIYFLPGMDGIIEVEECVKDLGIQVDHNLTYKTHRQKALTKVVKKLGWIRRTFSTRTTSFLKTIWNSLLQPNLDYGSVLVAPHTKGEKLAQEKPLRTLTKMSIEAKKHKILGETESFPHLL